LTRDVPTRPPNREVFVFHLPKQKGVLFCLVCDVGAGAQRRFPDVSVQNCLYGASSGYAVMQCAVVGGYLMDLIKEVLEPHPVHSACYYSSLLVTALLCLLLFSSGYHNSFLATALLWLLLPSNYYHPLLATALTDLLYLPLLSDYYHPRLATAVTDLLYLPLFSSGCYCSPLVITALPWLLLISSGYYCSPLVISCYCFR
jgi:hypothetical protein